MLARYKRISNIAAGIFLITLPLLIVLGQYQGPDSHPLLAVTFKAVLVIFVGSFSYALWAYAKSKGYLGGIGVLLALLNILGLLILLFLPDKTDRTKDQERGQAP